MTTIHLESSTGSSNNPMGNAVTSIINEDEGGGDGGGGPGPCNQERTKINEVPPTLDEESSPTKALTDTTTTTTTATTTTTDTSTTVPTSPSIRQQVTSVLWSMRNKLSPSHNIVEKSQPSHDNDKDNVESDDEDEDEHYEQAVDIFVKHLDQQQELERERQRRASLPTTDDIELTTLSGVVLRRKQQLHQLRQQQQQQQQQQQLSVASNNNHSTHHHDDDPNSQQQATQQHLMLPAKARPLSISSISSAASSGSSASSNSSSSSGIQSSLTRNSSLNYSQEFRKQSYLASIESLTDSTHGSPAVGDIDSSGTPTRPANDAGQLRAIESALAGLNLNTTTREGLALTRAAVLAAGESQRRNFGTAQGNRFSRINRSLHASLRYDKNTAYRIHLMANARSLMQQSAASAAGGATVQQNQVCNFQRGQQANPADDDTGGSQRFRRYSSISRNNSSTSSDSGHPRASFREVQLQRLRCTCAALDQPHRPPDNASGASAPTANSSLQDRQAGGSAPALDKCESAAAMSSSGTQEDASASTSVKQKAATLDGTSRPRMTAQAGTQHAHHHHHPDCAYSKRPRRASTKLQQSPSSVSSHSNNSSLFRDDGFEDDLTSTASEHSTSIIFHHHQLRQANQSHLQQQQQHEQQQQHHDHHRQLFYHQNQNHQLSYQRGHLQEGGLGLLTIAQRVVTEIIETERSYVDDLEQIVTGYLCYLRDVLEQHKELFSNLEDIHKFNKDFLFQLEECYLNPGAVAACFVENAAKFDVYTHYCTMYPEVVSTLTQLMADPTTAQVLKERQLELNQSLPLGAYLLKPVQRILKYHILFKSLIKHTADDESVTEKEREHINDAFSVMTNIACHINEMKKKHEHSIRVQELQGLLCGWEGPDLTTLGELILEDNFKLYNRQRSSRHLLLFDNVLLITKKKRDGSLCYKGHIACSNLMLIETIEGQPLVFNTVPFDNPKALCAFQADNLDRKRDWCLQMKEVIIKSFEVKIPVHVRDLLMSLTKSASTTDVSSGNKKSATSDGTGGGGGSNSKACIHAPKYLEKKRSRQEKKKQ